MNPASTKVRWSGTVRAIQSRARVWRYKTDNRTHYLLGFNVWLEGNVGDEPGKFCVAISGTQERKLLIRCGEVVAGTAWTVEDPKREVAGLYRAGALKVISRSDAAQDLVPPYRNVPPDIEIYEARGARMLDPKRWRSACMTCMWANKSFVEIEYNFGQTRRHRFETFCYGPKSCPLYERGPARPVPYKDCSSLMDDGVFDGICTYGRGDGE